MKKFPNPKEDCESLDRSGQMEQAEFQRITFDLIILNSIKFQQYVSNLLFMTWNFIFQIQKNNWKNRVLTDEFFFMCPPFHNLLSQRSNSIKSI